MPGDCQSWMVSDWLGCYSKEQKSHLLRQVVVIMVIFHLYLLSGGCLSSIVPLDREEPAHPLTPISQLMQSWHKPGKKLLQLEISLPISTVVFNISLSCVLAGAWSYPYLLYATHHQLQHFFSWIVDALIKLHCYNQTVPLTCKELNLNANIYYLMPNSTLLEISILTNCLCQLSFALGKVQSATSSLEHW